MKITSKIGTIVKPEVGIYNFLSNLNNLEKFIPSNQINNWQADEDSCKFSAEQIGEISVSIINREPYKTIKFKGESGSQPISFLFWIQLKEIANNDTKIRLTIDVELPMMMRMMAKKPIEQGLNSLVDRICPIISELDLNGT